MIWELESAKPWQGDALGDLGTGVGQTLSTTWWQQLLQNQQGLLIRSKDSAPVLNSQFSMQTCQLEGGV